MNPCSPIIKMQPDFTLTIHSLISPHNIHIQVTPETEMAVKCLRTLEHGTRWQWHRVGCGLGWCGARMVNNCDIRGWLQMTIRMQWICAVCCAVEIKTFRDSLFMWRRLYLTHNHISVCGWAYVSCENGGVSTWCKLWWWWLYWLQNVGTKERVELLVWLNT